MYLQNSSTEFWTIGKQTNQVFIIFLLNKYILEKNSYMMILIILIMDNNKKYIHKPFITKNIKTGSLLQNFLV